MRTALFNYLYAKKNGGKIVLRFEDTDKARSKKEFEDSIFESMQWCGLSFDSIYKQSERTLVYKKYLEKMIANGTAYVSDEAAFVDEEGEGEDEKEGEQKERRSQVIRFKNPNKEITFTDLVTGDITVDTTELKDFVIAKSLEEPLYHLAVVVDDFEMGVTHVIRGVDGIYNTPRQILIQEAIGATRPVYCHIPFVLGPDKAKLSKRNGSLPITYYRDQGYLPQALLNYLALLGWHPGDDKEIFAMPELIEAFELEKVQKAGAVFDIEKLKWINREHLKKLSEQEFRTEALMWVPNTIKSLPQWSEERFSRFAPELLERISIWSDIKAMAEAGELSYLFDKPVYEVAQLLPKAKNDKTPDSKKIEGHLAKLIEILTNAGDDVFQSKEKVKEAVWGYATETGRGEVLWPMRVALSGKDRSPDPFILSYLLGKTETLERLSAALERVQKLNA
jgi:glutamyl-tRNA synthetase